MKKSLLLLLVVMLLSVSVAQAAPTGGFSEGLESFGIFGWYDPDTYEVRNVQYAPGMNMCYAHILNYRRETIQVIPVNSAQTIPETIYYPQLYCLAPFTMLYIYSIYKIPIRYTYISSVKSPSGSYVPETTPYP